MSIGFTQLFLKSSSSFFHLSQTFDHMPNCLSFLILTVRAYLFLKQDQRSLPWPGDLYFEIVCLGFGWSWLLFVLVCLG